MITNVHVDCDSLWVYANEYGVPVDRRTPCIYNEPLHAFLELFEARAIKATFFVIGRDLQLPSCVNFCRDAVRAGHAIGNHTYSHFQDYRNLSRSIKEEEVVRCHHAISTQVGYDCKGFRCPGYYFDADFSEILEDHGYLYDTSVLPGIGVHLMKLVYRLFNPAAKDKRFGRASYLFAPRVPHGLRVRRDGLRPLWEFPIATCPLLMLPIHSTFVFQWGLRYFQFALGLSRLLRNHFVYLFHAIDLFDEQAAGTLAARVSSFTRPLSSRRQMVNALLDGIAAQTVSITEDQFPPARTARSA